MVNIEELKEKISSNILEFIDEKGNNILQALIYEHIVEGIDNTEIIRKLLNTNEIEDLIKMQSADIGALKNLTDNNNALLNHRNHINENAITYIAILVRSFPSDEKLLNLFNTILTSGADINSIVSGDNAYSLLMCLLETQNISLTNRLADKNLPQNREYETKLKVTWNATKTINLEI